MHGQPTIAFIGKTGAGKSSICNLLTDGDQFHTCGSIHSQTTQVQVGLATQAYAKGGGVRVLDTPGLGDTAGRDTAHIAAMCSHFKKEGQINCLALVFNATESRFDVYTRGCVELLFQMFGPGVTDHLVVVFSRWGMDRASQRRRHQQLITEEARTQEVQSLFQNTFDHSKHVPVVFVETDFEESSSAEVSAARQAKSKLLSLARTTPAFNCHSLNAVRGTLDEMAHRTSSLQQYNRQLQESLEEQKRKHEAERQKKEEEARREKAELQRQKEAEQARLERLQREADRARQEREENERNSQVVVMTQFGPVVVQGGHPMMMGHHPMMGGHPMMGYGHPYMGYGRRFPW